VRHHLLDMRRQVGWARDPDRQTTRVGRNTTELIRRSGCSMRSALPERTPQARHRRLVRLVRESAAEAVNSGTEAVTRQFTDRIVIDRAQGTLPEDGQAAGRLAPDRACRRSSDPGFHRLTARLMHWNPGWHKPRSRRSVEDFSAQARGLVNWQPWPTPHSGLAGPELEPGTLD
jgi:hypothetical protein